MSDPTHSSDQDVDSVDTCIIGAGITGLNALVVASSYLGPGARIALVDRRPQVGGMWTDTYGYVRLHQPHGIFTAGNVPWTLDVDPSHLATRGEVLSHLTHCLDVAKEQASVDEYFGWEYVSHVELPDAIEVRLRSATGVERVLRARRLIKALGHQLGAAKPIPVSSNRVRPTTPEMLVADPALASGQEPVWIVGAGKTAMDTAYMLITRFPGREVNLVAGPGVFFARRDTFFPVGARRWWGGSSINAVVREAANRFDGTNESDVSNWFRGTYGISPVEGASDFFNGYLSERECEIISRGLHAIEHEYLEDVADLGGDAQLVFRSGRTVPVPHGTWVVNCTGSLLRDSHPYEPFVSAGGRVASMQMRSSTTGIYSAFAGYYLTHLLFRGELAGAGLYALDVEDLHHKCKAVAVYASMSLAMHNFGLLSEIVPKSVLLGCGLDFDRWYPLPRRMLGATRFLLAQRKERDHHRQALDALGQRFDLICGPVVARA